MRRPPKAAVVIFARRPQLGRVKTRLVPPLTPAQALELHRALIETTARLLASLPRHIAKWLYLTGRSPAVARRTARALSLPGSIRVRPQRGRDLGARLQKAFAELFADGYERVLVIGSDSPTLSREQLRHALEALRRADAVIGPAQDGGFYLIGLRAVLGKSPMFRGIRWGTGRAFHQTLSQLRKSSCRSRILPLGWDVDTAADLRRLEQELSRRGHQHAHLQPLRTWFARRQPAVQGAKKL